MKRKLAIAAASLLALVLLAAVGAGLRARSVADEDRRQRVAGLREKFLRHRDRFVADHRALAAHPLAGIWAPGTGAGRDAGPTLNARIPWTGPDEQLAGWRAAHPPETLLATPKELVDALTEEKWWRAPEGVPLPAEQLAFLDGLAAYDRWDLASEGTPLATFEGEPFAAPLPSFLPLLALQRARHARGLVESDTAGAIRSGRALARLAFSSSTLIGAMIGVAILGMEAPAAAEAVRRGQPPDQLDPLPAELVAQLKRAVLASPWLFHLDAPEEATALLPELRAGRCAAIGEQAALLHLLRPWLGEDRPEAYARVDSALEEPGCSFSWMRRQWARPGAERLPVQELCASGTGEGESCAAAAFAGLPGMGPVIGELLLSIASPDPFRAYEAEPAP